MTRAAAAPTRQSNYYVYQGQCLPMETLTQTESWSPNAADNTPAGSQTLSIQRTKMGLVSARATVGGRPVVYTRLRATYMHELDSAVGFEHFNEPALMRNPADFMNAANNIQYTFNWFYTDDKHIAYFNSGANPVRAANTDPLFPVWSSHPWQGYNGDNNTFQQAPQSQHPQVTDQNYITSWNNKPAPGYANGDSGQEFSSIYRSDLLDNGINAFLGKGQKMTLPDLVNAMGTAATQDLRGVTVLPTVLAILGHPSDPQLASAVNVLSAWVASGSHRLDRTGGGHYDHAQAVQIMDAWWPLLVNADFGPIARTQPARPGRGRLPDQRPARARRQRTAPRLILRRGLLRRRAGGPARRARPARARGAQPRVLRPRAAGRLPHGAAGLAAPGARRDRAAGLPGRRRVSGRRPGVLGLDSLPPARRGHPAADPLAESTDVPAGDRDPGTRDALIT